MERARPPFPLLDHILALFFVKVGEYFARPTALQNLPPTLDKGLG